MKRITTDTIKSIYKDEDPRVIEFLCYVVEAIEDDIKTVPGYFKITLDMIKDQLRIYYKAQDAIVHEGVNEPGQRGENKKNAAIMTGQTSWNLLYKILSNIGLTPMNKAKLKKLQQTNNYDDSAEVLLDSLLN